MTSPIEAWNERYALERVRLPGDIDELEVICCESDTRVVSHIGIELNTCSFNNTALQNLRHRIAVGAKLTVQIRYNTSRMDRIWVEDPATHERFEVLNQDPTTRDLSAKQVAELQLVLRQMQQTGAVVSRAQARKRMEEKWAPLLVAKTMKERKRAHKMLQLVHDDLTKTSPVKPNRPASKALGGKQFKPSPPSSLHIPSDTPRPAKSLQPLAFSAQKTPAREDPPMFKVVRSGAAIATDQSQNRVESDADAH